MLDIPSISAIVVAAGVLIGVVYYVLEMRQQTRIRKTDLTTRLYAMITTNEFLEAFRKVMNLQIKDYEDYLKQYGSLFSKSPMHKAFYITGGFYDFVGILLYRKHIGINLVCDVIGIGMTKMAYEKLKPVVLGFRKELSEPIAFAGFEYVYNELLKKEPQLRRTWTKAALLPVSDPNSLNDSSR